MKTSCFTEALDYERVACCTGTIFGPDGIHHFTGIKFGYMGFDCDGLNARGFYCDGIHKDTQTKYDPNDFDSNGLDS